MRYVHLLLLLLTIVGGVLAIQAGREQSALRAEQRRLQAEIGDLRVDDPDRVAVLALATDDPLHFAWRVYLPRGYDHTWLATYGGGSASARRTVDQAEQQIVRLRFRQIDGRWEMWEKTRGGSSWSGGLGGSLEKLLENPARLRIDQRGRGGVETFAREDLITLLKLEGADARSADAASGEELPVIRFELSATAALQQP